MSETPIERIARLETRLESVEITVKAIDTKMDEIIALRNKGIGAFWLASTIIGTSIVSFFNVIWHWFKGV